MTHHIFAPLTLTALLALGTSATSQDRIHLKSGKSVEGKIVKREKSRVTIRVSKRTRRIGRRSIDRITDLRGHIRWVDAYAFKTTHYAVKSNVPRGEAEDAGKRLEMFHSWFFKNFKKAWKLHKVKRMGVKLFRTRAEFEDAFRRVVSKTRKPPHGFYFTGDETLYVTAENPSKRYNLAQNALFHEGGHQILHLSANLKGGKSGRARHWINEGIPCYFEALEVRQGRLFHGTNRNRILQALAQIKQGRHHPLAAFDALTREQYGVREYAQGYALAHFFMEAKNGSYRKPFLQFARDVFFGRDRAQSFEKRFGKEIAAFEPEWKLWVAARERTSRRPQEIGAGAATVVR